MRSRIAIRIFALMLLYHFGGGSWSLTHAQIGYLEQVGVSEVELMVYLKSGEHKNGLVRNGSLLSVERPGFGATYTVQRAQVVHLSYHQGYNSEAAALAAFEEAKTFLEERGVKMQVMRGQQHYRLMSGEGNGLRSTLVITAGGDQYRLNVEMIASR